MSDTTVVHLLRHGEVDNPRGIIYGRLPGYHLSATGRLMAQAAADYFSERPVVALFSSPPRATQETRGPDPRAPRPADRDRRPADRGVEPLRGPEVRRGR